jgi:hypothetical protein|mmetsp:Transcript_56988/g.90282  ORF Transcript_56988/g.90282 Transcript_56988/m.90282 type:complete len:372 (-) Transcript_56988:173-1288(-)
MSSAAPFQVSENEALIESSFRRLLAAVESEREGIRNTWHNINDQRTNIASHLEQLRQETEGWCWSERDKITAKWNQLDKLRERMSVTSLVDREEIPINCSGTHFKLQKSDLCSIEGSYLNHMFSDAFIGHIPKDSDGYYFLDFNPECFGIILKYLKKRRDQPDAPLPIVPASQQQNMDLLAEALKLKAFMPINRMSNVHGTPLRVLPTPKNSWEIEASTDGWQVVAASYPIPMASTSYFEIRVITNQDQRGGLAIGLCGHIPQGNELHTIRLADSVLYNSNVGIIGDAFAADNVTKGIRFEAGDLVGVKHDVADRRLEWFHNGHSIGYSALKSECLERMLQIYPVMALMSKGQKIEAVFNKEAPGSKDRDF